MSLTMFSAAALCTLDFSAAYAQIALDNIYIDRVGSRQAPNSTVNANWVGISDNSEQAEINTDPEYVRSGTTSIITTSTLTDGEPRNIRFDGLSESALAGDTVTVKAWFKAESTVRAYVALESPNTSYQSATRGNGGWQQISLSQVSDGGQTRFFLVPRGDAITGPHNVYWDDIEVTITPANGIARPTGGRANAYGLFSWDWQDPDIDVTGNASLNKGHFANHQFRHSTEHDDLSAVRDGGRLKFVLNPTSPATGNSDAGNFRKEIANAPWDARTPLGTEEWIGWQYTFGADYLPDPADWLLFQSKPIDNGIPASPPISLVVVSEGAYGSSGGELMVQNHANPPDNHLTGIFAVAGQTLDIVLHVVHERDTKGLLQVWIDGALVYDKQVRTVLENTPWGGNAKFGIYAWPWKLQSNIDASAAVGIRKRTAWLGPIKIYRKRPADPTYLADEYSTVAPEANPEPPVVSINDAVVSESDGVALVSLRLDRPDPVNVVKVRVFNRGGTGSATQGKDFWGFATDVEFSPGSTSTTVPVVILDDGITEPVEQIKLRVKVISNASLARNPLFGNVNIVDND